MIALYLWLGFTIAGGVRCALNLAEVQRELVAFRKVGRNGVNLVVARSHRFAESVRAIGYMIAIVLTVFAFTGASARALIDDGLVAFLALFVVNTFGTAHYKRKLDEAIAAASDGGGEKHG